MVVALASVVSKAPALCQEHGVGDVVSSAVQDGTTSKENLPFLISCFPDVLPSSEEERFQVGNSLLQWACGATCSEWEGVVLIFPFHLLLLGLCL